MNKCIREQTKVWEEEGGGVMNYETFNQFMMQAKNERFWSDVVPEIEYSYFQEELYGIRKKGSKFPITFYTLPVLKRRFANISMITKLLMSNILSILSRGRGDEERYKKV